MSEETTTTEAPRLPPGWEGGVVGTIYVCQPQYGSGISASHRQFWKAASVYPKRVHYDGGGSLLANSFNRFWAHALTLKANGLDITHFAMLHDDIVPQDGWLDVLMAEIIKHKADVVSALVPIKDWMGLTSSAIDHDDGFGVIRRITMTEAYNLPETFDAEDCGYPKGKLLANTGCWVCDFTKPWVTAVHEEGETDWANERLLHYLKTLKEERGELEKDLELVTAAYKEYRAKELGYSKVFFTIRDRIKPDNHKDSGAPQYNTEVAPEDWNFSRMVNSLGGRVMVTRRVSLTHWGYIPFNNQEPWGTCEQDRLLVERHGGKVISKPGYEHAEQVVQVPGWLTDEEGRALAYAARGKDVLEVGSYKGKSTIWMARVANSVSAVDTFDGRGTPRPEDTLKEFANNLLRYNVTGQVKVYQGPAEEILTEVMYRPTRFQFAFIDGSHDFASVYRDVKLVTRYLDENGGMIGCHDYENETEPGVTAAVNKLMFEGYQRVAKIGTIIFIKPTPERLAEAHKEEGPYVGPAGEKAQQEAVGTPTVLPGAAAVGT